VALRDGQLEVYANTRRRDERAESYATKYDRELHKRISSYFERRVIRRALAITGEQGATVLDVPCGAGRLTPLLAPISSRLISCDYSPAMLRVFRRAYRSPCFVGSAFDLPFADGSFRIVFSARLSHHIASDERRADYLREVMRISGRWVIVTIFDRASLKNRLREISRRFSGKRSKHGFARSDLERIAAACDFTVAAGLPLSRLASGHVFYVLRRSGPG
jgi:ubiquinone/menaquinone biosynthesis C-methylase UbiE